MNIFYLYDTIPRLNAIAALHWYSSFTGFNFCAQLSTRLSKNKIAESSKSSLNIILVEQVQNVPLSKVIFKPIRMLIDANIIFVRTKYPGIATWCCVNEQMELDGISNFIQLIWLRGPNKNGVFCCA